MAGTDSEERMGEVVVVASEVGTQKTERMVGEDESI